MRYPVEPRGVVLLLSLALAVASLSGCGRRGALDLPPEVAARPKQVVVEKTTVVPPPGSKQPVQEDLTAQEFIPGTVDHRPPAEYPFLLDPLL